MNDADEKKKEEAVKDEVVTQPAVSILGDVKLEELPPEQTEKK